MAAEEGSSVLRLSKRRVGDAGAKAVAANLLQAGEASIVRVLRLEDNAIGDAGAAALAELLSSRGGAALSDVYLSGNDIGPAGISALADSLRRNFSLIELRLLGNPGVDSFYGTDDEVASGIDALIAAVRVNTTLKRVSVAMFDADSRQKAVDAALADTEGRLRGRALEYTESLTKAARSRE
jgi:Leucine Rich repeat